MCLSATGQEAVGTFTAQYSPNEIATILERAGIVSRGYAQTPVSARTPTLSDAVLQYVSTPAVLRRYYHPCTPTPVSVKP